jgi:cysteine synthase A
MGQGKTTILDFIGNTPLVQMGNTFVKCEYMNPSGSIKARIAKFLIEKAEKEGLLKPGDTIVEATSGNTGNAMSMVAAVKGYKMIVIMPSDFSSERVSISKGFGAEVRLIGKFDVSNAQAEAKKLGDQEGYWCPDQFDNEWNVEENENVLGGEIINQLPEGVIIDAVVQGVGTGGTLIGVSKALKAKHNPNLKTFAMEPDEAALIKCGEFREHLIEGISDGFIPGIIARYKDEIDEVITVEGKLAIENMRYLAAKHGMFVGPSSGANWLAASKIRELYPDIKNILTFFCDEGEKYITQHF